MDKLVSLCLVEAYPATGSQSLHACVHDWMGQTTIDAPKILIRPTQILRAHLLPSR
jgi:hypothetical protein